MSNSENTAAVLQGADLIKDMGLIAVVKEDFQTNQRQLSKAGFQTLLNYRLGTYARTLPKILGLPFDVIYYLGFRFCRSFYGIELRRTAKIARRFEIGHQHGIVIHDFASFGNDCAVRQGVTFGIANTWVPGEGPVIGNNVSFGVGTVVIGNVTIGDNVTIGPNCVVSADIPSDRTLFVPPPRVLPKQVETDATGASD